MKKFFRSLKEDFKHPYIYIMMVLTIVIVLLSVFFFSRSYLRIYEACKDLISSFVYIGSDEDYVATVTLVPDNYYSFRFNINIDWNMFSIEFRSWWWALFTSDMIVGYFEGFTVFLMIFLLAFTLLIAVAVLFYFLFKRYFKESEKEDNRDSLPLKCFKAIQNKVFKPAKNFILNCCNYLKDNKWIYYIWIVIFVCDFNLVTIVLEFFAYYFYFIFSFDFLHLYIQLYKLIADLSPMLTFIPSFLGVLIYVLWRLHKRRLDKAYSHLSNMESNNKSFISSLGVSTLICGEMGIGKTSTMTDMVLSTNQYFRYTAFEHLLQIDLKFPNFPWVNLDTFLKEKIACHEIYSLATCRQVIDDCQKKWVGSPISENIFDYDLDSYGGMYYDGKTVTHIWRCIQDYAQLFLIYVTESSLIISNYSVRDDDILIDTGHFPLWDMNFFRKSYSSVYDKHSHISDFDAWRLGKTVLDDSPYKDSVEFGVVGITEGGKERLNAVGTREMKASDFYANQKNDNFDLWVKTARHSATVDNFCFIKIFIDEQRVMSLGADLREICQNVIFLADEEKGLCSLSRHSWWHRLILRFTHWFNDLYSQYKSARGDNTLFIYIFKSISAFFIRRETKIQNTFGYSKLSLDIESGSLDKDKTRHHDYFLCYHKIYSDRYSSDCFKSYYHAKAINSKYGLNDLPTYKSNTASIDELLKQNSYFINDLTYNIFADDMSTIDTSASSDTPQDVKEEESFKTDDTAGTAGEE